MESHMNVREKLTHLVFPKVGLRNIKTALAAALCALVYYFLDRSPAASLSVLCTAFMCGWASGTMWWTNFC